MPLDEAHGREGEQGWIQEAMAGDKEAFARLVDLHQRAVYNLAYRMLGNARDAEDVAQERSPWPVSSWESSSSPSSPPPLFASAFSSPW